MRWATKFVLPVQICSECKWILLTGIVLLGIGVFSSASYAGSHEKYEFIRQVTESSSVISDQSRYCLEINMKFHKPINMVTCSCLSRFMAKVVRKLIVFWDLWRVCLAAQQRKHH